MSISYDQVGDFFAVMQIKGNDSVKSFQELVHRAANLWPDAPAEIKEFADKVTNGQVFQKYVDDNKVKFDHYHCCSCGNVTVLQTINSSSPEYPITCEAKVRVTWNDETQPSGINEKVVPCKRMEMFNKVR